MSIIQDQEWLVQMLRVNMFKIDEKMAENIIELLPANNNHYLANFNKVVERKYLEPRTSDSQIIMSFTKNAKKTSDGNKEGFDEIEEEDLQKNPSNRGVVPLITEEVGPFSIEKSVVKSIPKQSILSRLIENDCSSLNPFAESYRKFVRFFTNLAVRKGRVRWYEIENLALFSHSKKNLN